MPTYPKQHSTLLGTLLSYIRWPRSAGGSRGSPEGRCSFEVEHISVRLSGSTHPAHDAPISATFDPSCRENLISRETIEKRMRPDIVILLGGRDIVCIVFNITGQRQRFATLHRVIDAPYFENILFSPCRPTTHISEPSPLELHILHRTSLSGSCTCCTETVSWLVDPSTFSDACHRHALEDGGHCPSGKYSSECSWDVILDPGDDPGDQSKDENEASAPCSTHLPGSDGSTRMVPKLSTEERRSLEDHARIKTSDEASGAEPASEKRRILPHDTSVTFRSWTENDEGRSQHLAEGGELPAPLDEANAAVAPTEISEATSEYYSQSSATSTITTMTTEDYATCLERGALQGATRYGETLRHREHTQGQPYSSFKDEYVLRGTNQVNNISEENRLVVGGGAAENSRPRDNHNDGSGDLSYIDDDGYSPLPFPDNYWSYDEVVRNYYHIKKANGGQKTRIWYPPEFLKAHEKARGVSREETYKNEYWTFDDDKEDYYHMDREDGHEIKVWYP